MTARQLDARAALGLLAVAAIWVGALAAYRTFPAHPAIAIAAAIDLAVTATLALYFVAVRGGHLPRWTLAAAVAAGLAAGKLVLARGEAGLLIAIGLELATLGWLVVRSRRVIRSFRVARRRGVAAVDALFESLTGAGFPRRLASVLATEIAIVTSLVTRWRRPMRSPARFTVHRESGWALYAGVIVFLSLGEIVAVHLLLAAVASTTIAWVVTGVSAYGMAWFVGDVLALRHGGITIDEHGLELAIGIRWRGRIRWAAIAEIASIERSSSAEGAVDVSILGANVRIVLREPVAVRGLIGIRREGVVYALSVDEPDRFIAAVRARGIASSGAEPP